MTGTSVQQRRDKRIPYYFVAFFVGLALVDGIMVTLAIRTQTGTVTEHPYEKGLAYNKVVDAANAQAELGWSGDIQFTPSTLGSLSGIITIHLQDKTSQRLTPDAASIHFTRPTQAGMDFTVDMGNSAQHSLAFPVKGLWEARLFIRHQGTDYQTSKRMVIE